ncbi:SpoIIE family protein phosphatase [Cellulosilyticum sp. I15G10I2]|uniref:SpoIIE family protein phosphatase n=1 Tax=Cellulosilyticum sp. I15G10I2 TaxID=1892843 RepID=UPI00085C88FF|nr:SpoIIE family protein phosphatase [Cellulosilyticum sp. I15G10I2]
MKFFMDFATGSLNKYGEELCGDKVEVFSSKDSFIAVLSDGLGSGVKANILATLTAKIAITMLKEGLSIEEVVDTIIHTLPICSVRKLAYSTFTIIKVDHDGMVYVVEFDNPSVFFIRNNQVKLLDTTTTVINGRSIKESKFKLLEKDTLVFVSDGVIHAGAGMILNLGWSWKEVANYLHTIVNQSMSAKMITNLLLGVCEDLYVEKPGDDTTVVTIKAIKPKLAALFSGPPLYPERDQEVVDILMRCTGKRLVCGGTAANIVSRKSGLEIKTNFDIIDQNIPPIAYMEGVDLVTEGVLTIRGAVEKLECIKTAKEIDFLNAQDGASKLAKILFEDCTHIKMLIGRAINPAHQNPDFPNELSIKLNVLDKLQAVLVSLGKFVEIEYY